MKSSDLSKNVNSQLDNSQFTPQIEKFGEFFNSGATLPVSFRIAHLKKLNRTIDRRAEELLGALHQDLGKPIMEAYISEIIYVQSEISHAVRSLKKWKCPQKRRSPLIAWPAKSLLYPEPYGVVLIIGPWNYPFQLIMSPLVGAIAAGNCICLKPSEFATHTSRVIADIVAEVFPSNYVSVFEGNQCIAPVGIGSEPVLS